MRALTIRALALATSLASLFVLAPGRADAFCRTWSCDPTKESCPKDPLNMACPGGTDGKHHRLFWPVRCVGFSLNQNASAQILPGDPTATPKVPAGTPEQKQALFAKVADQAFATWQNAACGGSHPSLDFADLGTVECGKHEYNQPSDNVSQGNANILVFRDVTWPYDNTSNVLALTTLTFNVDSGEIYDADMEINGTPTHKLAVDKAPGNSEYDLLSILTHEAGHFLGLAHAEETHHDSVMYATYSEGSVKRALTSDDTDGVCAIYPVDRTGLPECDPTPRHGYSTQCAQDVTAPGSCAIATSPTGQGIACLGGLLAVAGSLVQRRRRGRRAIVQRRALRPVHTLPVARERPGT